MQNVLRSLGEGGLYLTISRFVNVLEYTIAAADIAFHVQCLEGWVFLHA